MKTGQKFCAQRGTVLVFALLILVVAGTILGGIAQLAVTQSIAGQAEWEAVERRVQTENSRVLARQYILTQMWQGFGGLPAATLNNSATGGLGGFQITSVEPDFGYWLSVTQDDTNRINPFNLFERGGFQSAWANGLLRTRSDDSSTNNAEWGFQIRTRSPITAGFAFVNHWDATNTWSPAQRINMRQTNGPNFYATGYAALPRVPVSSVTNTNTGDTNGFLGFLLLPKAEAPFGTIPEIFPGAEREEIPPEDPEDPEAQTNAKITVDLGEAGYYVTPGGNESNFYEVPSVVDLPPSSNGESEMKYNVPVTDLELLGGDNSPVPIQILIPASNTNLSTILLRGNNSRIIYLYRKGNAADLVIKTESGNLSWRLGMTLDCEATFEIAGQLEIRGGVRTGTLLEASGSAPNFVSEVSTDPKFDAIADRMMWLEDQRSR